MSTAAPSAPSVPAKATIPFMLPQLHEADIEAVNKVLKSGMLRAAGKCEELEKRLGEMSGAKHAMTCANGTCALQLAYEPLFQRGDDVLVPAWSYIATAAMLVARGCNPIFVDADPSTGQIDVADMAKRITKNTKGVAATHMYGTPVNIEGVQDVAQKHGLKVVYDCAQSHLSTFKGQPVGKFGDAVTYSFYATKNLGTGEGGMITCNDDALARQIKLLRSHGETEKYLHEQVGYNYRMNDMAGAIACSRLDRLPQETTARQKAAARYDALLAEFEAYLSPMRVTPGAVSVYHLYTAKLNLDKLRCSRDEFCKSLMGEGVPTAVHYPRSLPQQPAFKAFMGMQSAAWPVADTLGQRVFSLPMHHGLTDAHFAQVQTAIRNAVNAFKK
ncbi:DegT/DnrJ/EryC1/StrS aminotransferase family protein [Nostoc sp. CHAB 5715]|uniref:DegT/DnrJ/EryC1/StrS family aminotransferase n=1 Tax=Nostoc sp. CHAB 5715 TaxID=2780400 RepID=UPI001E2DCC63|nr:DegT/DnrJ/EryC1/StrS family aminotransferase [Nostoc sp. CHAB 5715]MCC5621606.1 DegT/DnrJ/EryC1/StrS family aminotransferase [Nostoc sp. CHAB 5715]